MDQFDGLEFKFYGISVFGMYLWHLGFSFKKKKGFCVLLDLGLDCLLIKVSTWVQSDWFIAYVGATNAVMCYVKVWEHIESDVRVEAIWIQKHATQSWSECYWNTMF